MMSVPWKHVRPADEAMVVVITELRLRRWRDVPLLMNDALRLRRDFSPHRRAIGLSLAASPLRRTFWTLSLWGDEEALGQYHRSPEHRAVMRKYRGRLTHSRTHRWTRLGAEVPSWADAMRRLADVSS